MIFLILFFASVSFSQVPLSTESAQLQTLINSSEQQLQSLKEILTNSKKDTKSLEKASQILENLSAGIDQSIEKYQGTETYEKALLQLQTSDDYKKTYADLKQVREKSPSPELSDKTFQNLVEFQKDSVQANKSDLDHQLELQKVLSNAQAGFIPKIQAQAQLGQWQSNTRVSAQMTELLADIHAIREELRAQRLKGEGSGTISTLVSGSEIQNQKQKGRDSL